MADALLLNRPLPVGSAGKKSTGFWGVWTLIATEGSLFIYLLFSYYYSYFQTPLAHPPEGHPSLKLALPNTFILLSSSVFVWWSERGIRHRYALKWQCLLMAIAIALGAIFLGVQTEEWKAKSYGMTTNLYGSLYFTITGFHMAHVVVGLIILSLLLLWMALGYFNDRRLSPVSIGGLYWHFVDVVWLFIFFSLYLLPYITG